MAGKIRVYATARNLFTITGFSGVDPAQYPTNGLTPGTFNGGRSYYPSTTRFCLEHKFLLKDLYNINIRNYE